MPVYPCTAANVTIDKVSNIITARRLTDSVEPEPFRPRLTSLSNLVLPNINCIIRGPLAPSLPSTNAPPIQNKKGPKIPNRPSKKKFLIIPLSLPFISIHVSITEIEPSMKQVQCNQYFGSDLATWLFTPSSISNSMNCLARFLPNSIARPKVLMAVNSVAPKLRVGSML